MAGDAPKLLLHGIDTIQCAYYLGPPSTKHLNFAKLAVIKEQLRMNKSREPRVVTLGGTEFFLQPYGSSSGYPFVLTNEDFKIELGEFNHPSCFVTFRSQGLWRQSAAVLHGKFLTWAIGIGCEVQHPETLSRVDFCFDYSLVERDCDADSFVSQSDKDSQHREHGTVQTFTLGKGDVVLRVYDKVAEIRQQSAKVWCYELWGQVEHVWRIEWQVRKPVLKKYWIRTFADLQEHQGMLLHYLAEFHDTLRMRTEDSNRSRWPLHPLWVDLQQRITELHRLEPKRVDGKELVLDERLMRLTISIYGYLKRMAAVSCVKQGQSMMSEEEAYGLLGDRLRQLFEPFSWKLDVQKRMKSIELGEMVTKELVVELVNDRVKQVLLVAEAALPPSQFQAFRTVVLNHFGRNGLVGDLEFLDGTLGLQAGNGQGRNTPCTKGGGPGVAHDDTRDDLAVCFDGDIGDVTKAEVQLVESVLGELVQRILLTRNEEE